MAIQLRDVTDTFLEMLPRLTAVDLVVLRSELRAFPEDAKFLDAVTAEFKRRELEQRSKIEGKR